MISGQAAAVTAQVENFLAHREVAGVVGLLALVFFSSTAFTVIESAMAIIFYHRMRAQHRHFLVSRRSTAPESDGHVRPRFDRRRRL